MKTCITRLDFKAKDDASVKFFFEKIGAIGYVAKYESHWLAVILDDKRVMEEIENQPFIIDGIAKENLAHVKNGQFQGLYFLSPKAHRMSSDSIHIDGVSPNGLVRGWGWQSNGKPCDVRISVDGGLIGTFPVNRFRVDLLNAGIGTGCHGFSNRLPDRILDGKSHHLLIELIASDDENVNVLAKAEKTTKFPFHFNLERPWIGSGQEHSYTWTASDEAEYLNIRDSVLNGDYPAALARAAHFIDHKPRAIFLDFGVKDRCLIEDDLFQTFGHRLRRRWGEHFGRESCHLKEHCCKNLELPYNRISSPSNTKFDQIHSDSPWTSGGPLSRCPMPIRHFASKKLTMDFASAMGVKAPRTLGIIKSIADFDRFDFPSRYVLKPDFASGVELYLMADDINLFDGFLYSREAIRDKVGKYISEGSGREFIVEEFVQQEGTETSSPIIPLDYKFHCFGGKARIIHVDDKNAISRDVLHRRQSWLGRDWSHTPVPFRKTGEHPNDPIRRPECFPKMLNLADELAGRLKDYVRLDFYASPEGPVLGEITSYSHSGLGFSEYGDNIMGQAWEIFSSVE
ncbi:ATP-grasp fold amidoligase family protein [Paracoccus aerius]|uniref:Uncharacterized protein n=1 Tax=Paracoccus aerius TaxID=1915382 RepID=A0ABS1S0P1_9RHOB|nr:ATP-grasp fold amidoligase family protein [Paracoccus aerius]MBL3672271.1 hypothetical protein [Paracoccus aerius]GHG11211.1 hypothetical protein GCM10017322_03360 [Paracoccus aerius]